MFNIRIFVYSGGRTVFLSKDRNTLSCEPPPIAQFPRVEMWANNLHLAAGTNFLINYIAAKGLQGPNQPRPAQRLDNICLDNFQDFDKIISSDQREIN